MANTNLFYNHVIDEAHLKKAKEDQKNIMFPSKQRKYQNKRRQNKERRQNQK